MRVQDLLSSRSARRAALIVGCYLCLYLLLDFAGLAFRTDPVVSIWYVADAASLALLLVFGVRYAPAIIVTALVTNFITYPNLGQAAILVVWCILFPLPFAATAILLRHRLQVEVPPRRLRDVVLLILGCLALSGFLAAMFTLTLVFSSDAVPSAKAALATLPAVVFRWWIGEAIGLVVVTPLLVVTVIPWLLWRLSSSERRARPRRRVGILFVVEASAQVLSIAIVLMIVFGMGRADALPLLYLCFLPLIWVTLRHALRGATWAIALIDTGAILAARISGTSQNYIADLQVFMLTLGLTGLALGAVVDTQRESEARTRRSNIDLIQSYDATIEGWSRAMDLRDKETEGHTQRVATMTERLAREMGMGEAEILNARRGALLHDIGKMGVPDDVLLKPGKLTDDEWVLMRLHPQLAYDMLEPIAYLRLALDIPLYHHEKWDGSGYPRGLKGEGIPLAARLFAVIDVYDALTSDRPYREAWPIERAVEHIRAGAGAHFDPQAVECFVGMIQTQSQTDGLLGLPSARRSSRTLWSLTHNRRAE